jgi:hypothetical protein
MLPSELKKLCDPNSEPGIADLKALHDRNALEQQSLEVFWF